MIPSWKINVQKIPDGFGIKLRDSPNFKHHLPDLLRDDVAVHYPNKHGITLVKGDIPGIFHSTKFN